MTVPFDVGMMGHREVAEWDGSNEQDIVDWLNSGVSDPSKHITILSETATELTLHQNNGTNVVVPMNGWVFRGLSGIAGPTVALVPDKNAYWISDQYGRPAAAADIESP